MHQPKTNGGNFFIGAGDTNVSNATQKPAVNFQLDAMNKTAVPASQNKLHTFDVCL